MSTMCHVKNRPCYRDDCVPGEECAMYELEHEPTCPLHEIAPHDCAYNIGECNCKPKYVQKT